MRRVDWQTALKLKGGQIRHAIHSGGQIKSPTGTVIVRSVRTKKGPPACNSTRLRKGPLVLTSSQRL